MKDEVGKLNPSIQRSFKSKPLDALFRSCKIGWMTGRTISILLWCIYTISKYVVQMNIS